MIVCIDVIMSSCVHINPCLIGMCEYTTFCSKEEMIVMMFSCLAKIYFVAGKEAFLCYIAKYVDITCGTRILNSTVQQFTMQHQPYRTCSYAVFTVVLNV